MIGMESSKIQRRHPDPACVWERARSPLSAIFFAFNGAKTELSSSSLPSFIDEGFA